ncbi:MAG: hypothetical protein BJ554DRAFT_5857 [Olpidium bornovanus]|uniref:Uncharacterized protein n=1 Tax=Olpidium bornovanus TaxID=278681 RepID=A0A8H8DL62_9FUNG|nr:MAG: hypothetical protein BJ554DRAFT_5857 [Olpidium bornovanus]
MSAIPQKGKSEWIRFDDGSFAVLRIQATLTRGSPNVPTQKTKKTPRRSPMPYPSQPKVLHATSTRPSAEPHTQKDSA